MHHVYVSCIADIDFAAADVRRMDAVNRVLLRGGVHWLGRVIACGISHFLSCHLPCDVAHLLPDIVVARAACERLQLAEDLRLGLLLEPGASGLVIQAAVTRSA